MLLDDSLYESRSVEKETREDACWWLELVEEELDDILIEDEAHPLRDIIPALAVPQSRRCRDQNNSCCERLWKAGWALG
jgi:hypothetical protein